MDEPLATLYLEHLAFVQSAFDKALERSGFDQALIYSGQPRTAFLDDRDYPFIANPLFAWWAPLSANPYCYVHYTRGEKPVLVYNQPADYWHEPPGAPSGFWVDAFDVRSIAEPVAAGNVMPAQAGRRAYLGEWADAPGTPVFAAANPPDLIAALHEARTTKTGYELACMRQASHMAILGHRAAESAFRDGASEFAIHLAYLAATGHTDNELPYDNIIALNHHGATLHYTGRDRTTPDRVRSFLIDAGASFNGYAADVTRTHAADRGDEFSELVDRMDAEQRALCGRVRAGTDFVDLHLEAHRGVARVLSDLRLVDLPPEAIVDKGISSTFLPHGLGHPIGLQVHDVAGHQVDAGGTRREPPPEHPFLRQTRTLAPGNVTTIEPGLYFIDLLLAELKSSANARHIAWDQIDRLRGYGGVRIEDNLVVADGGPPENLTRNAFAA